MIYTCYEMIADCRAGKPEGWAYFITRYMPVLRKMVAHYAPEHAGDNAFLERLLLALHRSGSDLFGRLEPCPERIFVVELRQHAIRFIRDGDETAGPDPAEVMEALEPFSSLERQAVWLGVMRYTAADAARMLHMDTGSVEKMRARAADRSRGTMRDWGRVAPGDPGPDCVPGKLYLDMIDGRTTWQERERIEQHVNGCLHCLDHLCRTLEVVDWLRGAAPLADAEAATFRARLGVETPQPSRWKRLLGAR